MSDRWVPAGRPAILPSQVDLLTVVSHEIGHLLGYDHCTDAHALMAETLPAGTRRLPGGDVRAVPALPLMLLVEIETDALPASRARTSDVFQWADLVPVAPARPVDPLHVGVADQTSVRAVDRLMALLGRRRTESIQPLEDVVEELINAEDL
jgi:hypothetical protein